ncbi:ATP-binding cassette domain-containing protein [Nesterenkonia ebinurensis]|uniref:ATP-binding cassette domain-containing protein n=1 Tax=Nesterenkonia ebinurensis TaxID=2608252 RepID=UPI00123CFFD8|nr:ATP-binding cassette domain-containing protein [Nesterenkonia ebinurensis]
MTDQQPLLDVRNLCVDYPKRGAWRQKARVLDGVSIDVRPGETVGLVGESGSGKSTLGRAVLGLSPVSEGEVHFDGEDISRASAARRRELASALQVVFQDPYGSLNPAMTIRDTVTEPLRTAGISRAEAVQQAEILMDQVQLPSDSLDRYPNEFSGGQRQRVAIARALIRRPRLIVCDEIVSALDLSTQARILDLLMEIQQESGVSLLFTSHDLGVIRAVSHRVAVLYRGRLVEFDDVRKVTEDPTDPYTRRLLMASPVPDPERQRERRVAYRREFPGAVTA